VTREELERRIDKAIGTPRGTLVIHLWTGPMHRMLAEDAVLQSGRFLERGHRNYLAEPARSAAPAGRAVTLFALWLYLASSRPEFRALTFGEFKALARLAPNPRLQPVGTG
jgi:hypothetical protein